MTPIPCTIVSLGMYERLVGGALCLSGIGSVIARYGKSRSPPGPWKFGRRRSALYANCHLRHHYAPPCFLPDTPLSSSHTYLSSS